MADPVTAAMVNSFLGAKVDALDSVVDGVETKVDTANTNITTVSTKVDNISVPKQDFDFVAGGSVSLGDRVKLDGAGKVVKADFPLDAAVNTTGVLTGVEGQVVADLIPVPGSNLFVLVLGNTDFSSGLIDESYLVEKVEYSLVKRDQLTETSYFGDTQTNIGVGPNGNYLISISTDGTSGNYRASTVSIDKVNKVFGTTISSSAITDSKSFSLTGSNYKSIGLAYVPEEDLWTCAYLNDVATDELRISSITVNESTLAVTANSARTVSTTFGVTKRVGLKYVGDGKVLLYNGGDTPGGQLSIEDFNSPNQANGVQVGTPLDLAFPTNNHPSDTHQGEFYYSAYSDMYYWFATDNNENYDTRYNAVSVNTSTDTLTLEQNGVLTDSEIDSFAMIDKNHLPTVIQVVNSGKQIIMPNEDGKIKMLNVNISTGALTSGTDLDDFTSSANVLANYYYLYDLGNSDHVYIETSASSGEFVYSIINFDDSVPEMKSYDADAIPEYVGVALEAASVEEDIKILLDQKLVGTIVTGFSGLTVGAKYYVDALHRLNTNALGTIIGVALTSSIISRTETNTKELLDAINDSSLPVKGKLKSDIFSFVAGTATDLTVLFVTSGGGVVHGINLFNGSADTLNINSIKVTKDGGAEETINLGGTMAGMSSGTTRDTRKYLPVPVKFDESCTVKLNYTESGTGGTPAGIILYTVNEEA